MPDDNISTNICHECCEHLEDFNNFWQLVEQKQGTLKKEFLNVDVDCVALKWTGIDVDVNIDELPLVADEMDEKPLDIHNLSLLGSVLDVNVDSVEVPQLTTAPKQAQTEHIPPLLAPDPTDDDDDDEDVEEKPTMHDSSDSARNASSDDVDDDDDGKCSNSISWQDSNNLPAYRRGAAGQAAAQAQAEAPGTHRYTAKQANADARPRA